MADNEISGTENANGVPQLKPCPFCGGDDVNFVRAKLVFDNTIGYMPLCADCGCAVGGNIDTEFTAYTDFHTEAEAIDAWNTRAEPIVRCRDCKYLDVPDWDEVLAAQYGEPPASCMRPDGNGDYMRFEIEPDGFCKWGERK